MKEIRQGVLNFFSVKINYTTMSEVEIDEYDYIKSKTLDSIEFITLISVMENDYGIIFSQEDLESPEFRTLGGLIRMINNKKNG
jgi:acyl carrier protein